MGKIVGQTRLSSFGVCRGLQIRPVEEQLKQQVIGKR